MGERGRMARSPGTLSCPAVNEPTAPEREPREAGGVLDALAAELSGEGLLIGGLVRRPAGVRAPLAELLEAGPRTAQQGELYGRVIECVREGYLLHYGAPRLLEPPDPDLALLAGDYLYAKGIGLLASIGDLEAVAVLADLISVSAELHAAAPGDAAPRLGALWLASAVAIATGPLPADREAVALLRAGGSAQALYAHAADRAAPAGLGDRLVEAAETVGSPPLDRG